jgi:hypothetical protein
LKTFYKCTRANGRDFRTNTVEYKVGTTVEVAGCDPPNAGSYGKGLHVSPTAFKSCLFGDKSKDRGHWRWFECEVDEADILASDQEKTRVRKLRVSREIPKAELFGDLKARAAKVRKTAATFKRIPWLKPKCRVTDAEVRALVDEWREALQSWAKTPLPPGVLVVRTAADADAAAAAAACDADADAAYAYAAAAAAAYAYADKIVRNLSWYVYPRWVLCRFAWFEFARKPGQPNPWEPLVKLYRLGCLPVGYVKGKDGPQFAVYAPAPKKVTS